MKIKVESDSHYHILCKQFPNKEEFSDIEVKSAYYRDLVDKLDDLGISYEVYHNVRDNGCTVFYDDLESSVLNESAKSFQVTVQDCQSGCRIFPETGSEYGKKMLDSLRSSGGYKEFSNDTEAIEFIREFEKEHGVKISIYRK